MSRVLYVGDVHEPVAHPGYIHFCRDLYEKWKCDKVVFIGDIIDWHAISFHSQHPDAPGPKDEYNLALERIAEWYKVFPVAKVCIGNHDERVVRVAEEAGIPSFLIRQYAEVWNTPKWEWGTEFATDDVYAFHGTGTGGIHPAYNSMKKMLMSVVQGHIHSAAGIKWCANPYRRIFGMDTGCGIDDKAIAFAYGRHQKVRSVLGAGVVIDGVPYHEIMQIGPGEPYNRSRFSGDHLHEKSPSEESLRTVREVSSLGSRPLPSVSADSSGPVDSVRSADPRPPVRDGRVRNRGGDRNLPKRKRNS